MQFRKITEADARRVINKVEKGLTHGVGPGGDGHMCVQHVVSNVVEGRHVNYTESIDKPQCVISTITRVGIDLNDAHGWHSAKARGEGLKRLAVAELGTNSDGYVWDEYEFQRLLEEQNPDWYAEAHGGGILTDNDRQCTLARLAEDVVQVLIKMKTPGSKFLWLTEDDPMRPKMNSPLPTYASVSEYFDSTRWTGR